MEDELKEASKELSAVSSQPPGGARENAGETDMALAQAGARVAELEKALAGKDAEIAGLRQSRETLEAKLQAVDRALVEAVSGYRGMLVEANPGVLPELISGDSLAAINESLERAKALVARVKKGLEAEASLGRFPAGAPERGAGGVDLSAREKIQRGIQVESRK
jgi:chromosome segregation ATPase